MGIKLIRREWKSGSVECCHKYICDTEADFDNLPVSPAGSTAVSLWSKKELVVNTKGRWVPYGENFVGSPILELVTEEGGASEATEVITADSEFSHPISTFGEFNTYRINCSIGNIDRASIVPNTKVHIDKHYKVMFTYKDGSEPTVFYLDDDGNNVLGFALIMREGFMSLETTIEDESHILGYVVPDNLEEILSSFGVTGETLTMFTNELPPSSILIIEDFINTPNLEAVSITYETEGGSKTMISVTDTNDEGIVSSYEVYADEALVDTVPKAETIDATALGVTAGASVTVKAKSIIDTTSEASNAVIFE